MIHVFLIRSTYCSDLSLVFPEQMLEGLVKKIALDFDVGNIAKQAKSSRETKISEIGADIELITKQS